MKTGAAMHSTKAAAMSASAQIALVDRLLARIVAKGDCWIWQGPCDDLNPRFYIGGKHHSVRRALFTALVGPLHEAAILKLACNGPACVNPHHCRVLSGINPAKTARRIAAKPVVVAAPAPRTYFVFDGTELGVNAFTAALGART